MHETSSSLVRKVSKTITYDWFLPFLRTVTSNPDYLVSWFETNQKLVSRMDQSETMEKGWHHHTQGHHPHRSDTDFLSPGSLRSFSLGANTLQNLFDDIIVFKIMLKLEGPK